MNFFFNLSNSKIDFSKPAILYKNEAMDYSSMFGKISSIKTFLQNRGIKRNDKIALLGDHNSDFIIAIFALWELNAIPVPINNRLLKKEIESQVAFSGCKYIIHSHSFKEKIKDIDIDFIDFNLIKELSYEESGALLLKVDSERTALILFTSGSTGNPKAVMLSFNNFIRSAEIGEQVFKHNDKDIWLAALPFFHVGGFSIVTRTFLYGATLAIPNNIDNESLQQSLQQYNPTLTAFVTTQLNRLLNNNIKPNPGLRHILLGGGFIDNELVRNAYNNGWNVSKSFGATETSSFVTVLTKNNFELKPDSAGKALLPNKIFIIDEDRNILTDNSPGEIVIESDSVAQGYLNNKEETGKKFFKNMFYTGDYGYLDNEGYLYIEARRSDLIVSGGENINPYEIEKMILKHPDVIDVVVFGLEDKDWGHSVAAALITKGNKQLTIIELRNFIKDKLPSYKHPKKIFILDSFPKTALGKIRKEQLKEIIKDLDQSL